MTKNRKLTISRNSVTLSAMEEDEQKQAIALAGRWKAREYPACTDELLGFNAAFEAYVDSDVALSAVQ